MRKYSILFMMCLSFTISAQEPIFNKSGMEWKQWTDKEKEYFIVGYISGCQMIRSYFDFSVNSKKSKEYANALELVKILTDPVIYNNLQAIVITIDEYFKIKGNEDNLLYLAVFFALNNQK